MREIDGEVLMCRSWVFDSNELCDLMKSFDADERLVCGGKNGDSWNTLKVGWCAAK